jgi:hypothetical protein
MLTTIQKAEQLIENAEHSNTPKPDYVPAFQLLSTIFCYILKRSGVGHGRRPKKKADYALGVD